MENSFGALALIPPIVAITMALITKQTILSLLAGIWVGTTIIYGWNPFVAIPMMISDYFFSVIGNSWNASMITLIIACGGFVYMIRVSGASKAFGDVVVNKIKTRKTAQLVAYFSAFAFIYTEPTLTLGAIMRPITEKLKVSRVKLAYICDVMGCPFAAMSPITSYGVYATGLVATQMIDLGIEGNPWNVFVRSIPMNFYALFGMLALLYVIVRSIDIGPMYEAEKRAVETGLLIGENDKPMTGDDESEFDILDGKHLSISNFLVPIGGLFTALFGVILWTGEVAVNGVGGAFMSGNITLGIITGFFVGGALAGVMGARSNVFSYKEIMDKFVRGVALNTQIPIILVLAWSIGSITSDMNLRGYLITIVENTSIAPGFIPALIFVVGAFVGFSTGSSWGVWAIMMPIGLPMAHAFGIPLTLMIGAVLSGGVFGDHCSPISDTTILASTAAGADHIEHVRTQLPYALTVGLSSAIGFIAGGFISPLFGMIVAAASIVIGLAIMTHRSNELKQIHAANK
ncbi:Na+/H+ antiporter NhaC family protein [Anoxynatronum sibiricum]|uniref:Na+/H+ antiporter NhaC family protein n=1 Tax=Anoxynatronum sibiricum TaxID=210623 RepID=A0ABU9VVL9_9CLOT